MQIHKNKYRIFFVYENLNDDPVWTKKNFQPAPTADADVSNTYLENNVRVGEHFCSKSDQSADLRVTRN
jgi:hypothetical protein